VIGRTLYFVQSVNSPLTGRTSVYSLFQILQWHYIAQ
jgi:hypothetical protein